MIDSPKRIYAREGEWITCEANNHPICQFVETVFSGDSPSLDRQLSNWSQPAIPAGTPIEQCVCGACGSPFVRKEKGHHHFSEGWR